MNRLSIRHIGDDGFYDHLEFTLTGTCTGTVRFHESLDALTGFAASLAAFPIDPERPPTYQSPFLTLKVLPPDLDSGLRLAVWMLESRDPDKPIGIELPMTYLGVGRLEQAFRAFAADPDRPVEVELG